MAVIFTAERYADVAVVKAGGPVAPDGLPGIGVAFSDVMP
jgi:hypothetical protein